MLHNDQSVRLDELCQKSLPHLLRESEDIKKQLQELRWDLSLGVETLAVRSRSPSSLKHLLSQQMHRWAHEATQLLEGKVDVHDFLEPASTADEDIQWLSEHGSDRFKRLPSLERDPTQRLLDGSFFTLSGALEKSRERVWIPRKRLGGQCGLDQCHLLRHLCSDTGTLTLTGQL